MTMCETGATLQSWGNLSKIGFGCRLATTSSATTSPVNSDDDDVILCIVESLTPQRNQYYLFVFLSSPVGNILCFYNFYTLSMA